MLLGEGLQLRDPLFGFSLHLLKLDHGFFERDTLALQQF